MSSSLASVLEPPQMGPAERAVMAAIHERNRNAAAAMQLAMAHEELNKECSRLDAVERGLERMQNEALAAKAAEARAEDAARAMSDKLAEAMAKIGELEYELQSTKAERDALVKDNDGLLNRLTDKLLLDAEVQNSEVERQSSLIHGQGGDGIQRRESTEAASVHIQQERQQTPVPTPVD